MSQYLYHVTLDTGDIASTSRRDVSDDTLDILAPHLRRAVETGKDIIPTTNYQLRATATGPYLLGTIHRFDGLPVLTFGIAPKARGAARLWDLLTSDRTYQSDPGEMPPAPWCAARMEAGASQATLEDWMGDYERCIAWAWIEKKAK